MPINADKKYHTPAHYNAQYAVLNMTKMEIPRSSNKYQHDKGKQGSY